MKPTDSFSRSWLGEVETLAHFGWGPQGKVLDDTALPATLVGDWHKQEGHEGKAFPTFARLLPQRVKPTGESDFSWTIDFAARRAKAREDMAPHLAQVEKQVNEIIALKEKLTTLKKGGASENALAACRDELVVAERAQRDAQAKTDAIDAATFDLKAVNPSARVVRDRRTPLEILASIDQQGQRVQAALAMLRSQLNSLV